MPKYRVLERSFINNTIVEAGAEVEYDGKAGSNLEAIEPEGKAEKAKPKADKSKGDADGLV